MGSSEVILSQNLRDYFYQQLRLALANQEVQPQPHTEFYLVNLLSEFLRLNPNQPLPHKEEKAMALYYLESLQMSPDQAWALLKYLGDMTLYVSGFFQARFQRKHNDLQYYMSLGGSAYHRLAYLSEIYPRGRSHREIFKELAENFSFFVDVFSEISENSHVATSLDLLKLYERWIATGSKRLLQKLQAQGIHPHYDWEDSKIH